MPVQRSSTSPSPLKKVLPPPHFESTSTVGSEAIHESDCQAAGSLLSTERTRGIRHRSYVNFVW